MRQFHWGGPVRGPGGKHFDRRYKLIMQHTQHERNPEGSRDASEGGRKKNITQEKEVKWLSCKCTYYTPSSVPSVKIWSLSPFQLTNVWWQGPRLKVQRRAPQMSRAD